MSTAELRIGQVISGDLQYTTLRGDKRGQLVTVGGGGQYQEAAYRGSVFTAAAAVTTSVTTTTTFTGLAVCNPNKSAVNLAIISAGAGLTSAAAAVNTLGLMGGWSATDQPQTTPGVITRLLIDQNFKNPGTATCVLGCTLNVTPLLLMDWASWSTTTTTGSSTTFANINGQIVVAPGGFVALYTTSAAVLVGHITFAEIPL